ncbi:MAG: MFS transporter, partial [Pirellulaceae bacterium]|nr:MFS transporter [Pirellulaceae bacterium]
GWGGGGVGGVAWALVAVVFPARARARTSSIFHGSSVLGSYMAAIAGIYVVGNSALGEHGWRWGFAIGALPALLTIWIRVKLREPDSWVAARDRANKDESKRAGRISELFSGPHIRGTMIGLTLSTVGLATFWGVHIYGKNFLQRATERSILQENAEELTNLTAELTAAGRGAEAGSEAKKTVLQRRSRESKVGEMLGMIVTTTGGGIGLFAFGPICEWIGRRGAFFFYHIGAFIASLVLFYVFPASSVGVYCWTLPVFGFFTLGMHAGYAVYFPELYPTRLRGTGGGFCFNVGRISAAGVILLVGLMSSDTALNRLGLSAWALSERGAATALTCMFLLGAFIVLAAPETKGRELPE